MTNLRKLSPESIMDYCERVTVIGPNAKTMNVTKELILSSREFQDCCPCITDKLMRHQRYHMELFELIIHDSYGDNNEPGFHVGFRFRWDKYNESICSIYPKHEEEEHVEPSLSWHKKALNWMKHQLTFA